MKNCEGCKASCYLTYENNYAYRRGISFDEFKKKCPCSKCIVKVICEEVCFKFHIHVTGKERLTNRLVSRLIKPEDEWTKMAFWDGKQKKSINLCGKIRKSEIEI
ncbi:MAG: hypothetical protein ACFFG0_03835 [Candidatus Thorarchaeota archaeon]